jgi:hypothetical protein
LRKHNALYGWGIATVAALVFWASIFAVGWAADGPRGGIITVASAAGIIIFFFIVITREEGRR